MSTPEQPELERPGGEPADEAGDAGSAAAGTEGIAPPLNDATAHHDEPVPAAESAPHEDPSLAVEAEADAAAEAAAAEEAPTAPDPHPVVHHEEGGRAAEEQRAGQDDRAVALGRQWGRVEGKAVWQVGVTAFEPRSVGEMRGANPDAALAYYARRFDRLVDRVEKIEREAETALRKSPLLGRVERLAEALRKEDALGDFDGLLARVGVLREALGAAVAAGHAEAKVRKTELIAKVAALLDPPNWKAAADTLRGHQEEWKKAGSAGREDDEALWKEFRSVIDTFFARRTEFFAAREREFKDNVERKEAICVQAEALADGSDALGAVRAVKDLQAAWQQVGPVPRPRMNELWDRFRAACDRIFTQAREEHRRRQSEWTQRLSETVDRKREQAERLRESIQHDIGNVRRWEEALASVRPGPRADEVRKGLEEKVASVNEKIEQKRARLIETETALRDIVGKLSRRQKGGAKPAPPEAD